MESPALSGRMARWQILLTGYDIVYVSQKSIKGSAIADFLASRTTEEYEPLRFDFPDEDLMCISEKEGESSKEKSWKMNFDGASNALRHGIRAVLVSPEGDHYLLTARLNFFYNQLADALATLASMFKANRETEMMPIQMSIYETPAPCFSIEEESNGRPWFHDILEYIKNQRYPEQANENDKRKIRRMAIGFVLDGDILYKRGKDQVLLRYVDAVEARKILEEVHEGICGTHASGFAMARQIMRLGYYWLTMERDCIDYARKCHKCQIYGDKIHVAPLPLHVMTSSWPFYMWGMDVIGPISPKASNGHRFIFVIKHHNSSPYRPKMNGAVEAANNNIKRIIGKMTETYKDWHEKLPFALYAYRTSVRTSTGATPFSLVYGMEAVLPIEVEIPSLRVLLESKLEESEWVQARYDQLNLIEGKRLKAICHGQIY
ncbi:uncharacterized protein LOC128041762 [Gossypium raimondii]|uniref:uncharacterized protein LOC128041762 n=1 Tax=Gossypium raimondii TaxID=29730 RepID=UPI00227CDA18|nr:uncharacterized protein LOC128041762 [Gossypium raimondii]